MTAVQPTGAGSRDRASELETEWALRVVPRYDSARREVKSAPEMLLPIRRYSFAPLAAKLGWTPAQAARELGVAHRDVHRGLSEAQADRLAVRAGFHPIEVWPDFGHEGGEVA